MLLCIARFYYTLQKDSITTSIKHNAQQLTKATSEQLLTDKIIPVLAEERSALGRVDDRIIEEKTTLRFMESLMEQRREMEMIEIFHQLNLFGES